MRQGDRGDTFLEAECPKCKGNGRLESAEWKKWRKRTVGKVREAIAAGDVPSCPEWEPCDRCGERGLALTEAGERMIAFFGRNVRGLIEEISASVKANLDDYIEARVRARIEAAKEEAAKGAAARIETVVLRELGFQGCPEDVAARAACYAASAGALELFKPHFMRDGGRGDGKVEA